VNRRLVGAVVVLLTLFTLLQVGQASGATPYITRLRVELSGTSDWEALEIQNADIPAIRVESVTSGAYVTHNGNRIALNGSHSASAVVSMIVEVAPGDSYTLVQGKGNAGTSRAKVYRTNTTDTLVADITNTTTSGDSTVYRDVSRTTLVAEGLTIPRVDPRKLVLAFYYPWYQEGSFDSGPWYDTPSSAYRNDDAYDIDTMVAQAVGAGIDGFIVDWDDVGNHAARMDMVLEAAKNRAFFVTPVIEVNAFKYSGGGFDLAGIEATTKKALLRASNPKFLKLGSRPVVFVSGIDGLAPSEWRSIVTGVAASGQNPFYVGDSSEAGYGLGGGYIYNPNLQEYDQLANTFGEWERAFRYPSVLNSSIAQRLWAATVSPGQNFSYFDKFRPRNEARNDGDRYAVTWQAALLSDPEWILVTSWNEYYEATHISPSERFGYTALNQTGDWAAQFHNPSAGDVTAEPSSGGLLTRLNPLNK
jgi:hypothetical protein